MLYFVKAKDNLFALENDPFVKAKQSHGKGG
jgi:hypothetical protein